MKNIGKYNGISCYECSVNEYRKNRESYERKDLIYIIEGIMVHKNVIIGRYDNKVVHPNYEGKLFYKPKVEVEKPPVPKVVEGEDIVFSDYSKVVDEFFAVLASEGK